jgi:hypothetical protein
MKSELPIWECGGVVAKHGGRRGERLPFRAFRFAGFSAWEIFGFEYFHPAHKLHHDIDRVAVRVYADTAQTAFFQDFEQEILFFC